MNRVGTRNPRSSLDTTCPEWYRATTLGERIAAMRATSGNARLVSLDEESLQRGERRLEQWRSGPGYSKSDSEFAARLAADGLSEEEFRGLLGEPAEGVLTRFAEPPAWLEELRRSFDEYPSPEERSSDEPFERGSMGLLSVAAPLIYRGRRRLQTAIDALVAERDALPFEPRAVADVLFAELPERLGNMVSRIMILEMHVAKFEGRLTGDSPEERFESFLDRIQSKDVILGLLREYPVLARQLVTFIDQWVVSSTELLRRLCEDWRDIEETFCQESGGGKLVEVVSAGDRHRGGRATALLKFDGGLRLVYKPRSLTIDVHFQELLDWLNEEGEHPPFRTLKVLDRDAYGWVEYVEARSCTDAAQVQRFYRRQGGYLAILYTIGATDVHFENVIAAGEHPVLLDLESLFQPVVFHESDQPGSAASSDLVESVMGIGLLPRRIWGEAGHPEGIDISGLGGQDGQMTPHRLPYWENPNTDEMRMARKRMGLPGGQNLPTLNGAQVEVMRHVGDVTAGFSEVYRTLMENRDELLRRNGLIERFAEDEIRYICRATRTYALLLHEGFHPDFMRDALSRERYFDALWVTPEQNPEVARLFRYEREDLHEGDIPAFFTYPGSHDLWTSSNHRLEGFFEESALQQVGQRLRRLDHADLERQLWIIRASFVALVLGENQAQMPRYAAPEPTTEARGDELLAAARRVGDRLEHLSRPDGQGVTWLNLQLVRNHVWSIAPVREDVYDGLPGIALFLGYLGALTGDGKYTDLAKRSIAAAERSWRQVEEEARKIEDARDPSSAIEDGVARPQVGAFAGFGGAIYALTHLSALWNRPDLLDEAERLAEFGSSYVAEDRTFDVVAGVSGFVDALLCLQSQRPSEATLKLARQCGDHLVAHARREGRGGMGWARPEEPVCLTGYSHGAAGSADALLRLAAATGDRKYREVALQAIAYERSVFSPAHGNWPDFREPDGDDGSPPDHNADIFMTAWCHGAPGIGLARLRALEYVDDPELRVEIDTAVGTTFDEGFNTNHSLCHGALGNIELPLRASIVLGDHQLRSEVYRIARGVLDSIEEHGWLCGVPYGVETPGLMTGLAGIGYGLLRLAEPETVPSVLELEPPKKRVSSSGGTDHAKE